MTFWFYMLFIDMIIPLTMIIVGLIFLKRTPKYSNNVFSFGYRSNMSVKNHVTWAFAHNYCGKLWLRCGIVLLPVSVIPLMFFIGDFVGTVGIVGGIVVAVHLVVMFASMFMTEAALKRNFDKVGRVRKK